MRKKKIVTVTSRRNCKKCHRWRPISDYRPYFSRKRNKEYLLQTCECCKKKKDLDRYYSLSVSQRNRFKERTREYAAARRRREGIPVRNNITKDGYGAARVKEFSGCGGSVDPAPLLREARRLLWNNKEIAQAAKVDVRRVHGWIHDKMNMNLDAADNMCIALGTHLEIMYPYEN